MSGSKTKYYVSSSCFPIFDPLKRMNHYEAAILDYTSNSPIELSEYMKRYYDNSRLRNYRGYLNWCDTKGYTNTFGKITSVFYGNAIINNDIVTEAIRNQVSLEEGDSFQVYQSNLNFFSEDFYIKHLATEQGHADWVYQENDIDYTISYPTADTIQATFEDDRVISGKLPEYTSASRFLEISYSIIRQTETLDPITQEPIVEFQYIYGFYQYQEGHGNTTLDNIIKNNGIQEDQTFYPVVPLRTNTAWYSGSQKDMIEKVLEYLEISGDRTNGENCYKEIQDACIEGMKEGSINDIDYITMILGVTINSTDQADLRYIYEFFFNVYANYALKTGLSPTEVYNPKNLNAGANFLGQFSQVVLNKFNAAGHNDSYYTQFTLNNSSSNFNYIYSWGSADYFECNGKFRPDAKVGDYGVLTGDFEHRYSEQVPSRDDEGNIEHTYSEEDGWQIVYETKWYTVPYTLVFFCHQQSENRWRFTLFVDLKLTNLIYAGKTIQTKAHEAIMDCGGTATVTHNFAEDFPSAPGIYHSFTLNYITAYGDPTTAFLVPLEESTFREIGVVNQMAVSYGSQYLVFNCWVAQKLKWYQRGWFSVALSFVGMVVSFAMGFQILGTFFATVFAITFTAVHLEIALKILQAIFGDRLGLRIYNFVLSLVSVLASYVAKCIPVFGWILGMAIMFTVTAAEAIRTGADLWTAVRQGLLAGIGFGAGYVASSAASSVLNSATSSVASSLTSVGVSQGVATTVGEAAVNFAVTTATSTLTNVLSGKSFSEAFRSGMLSGIFNAGLGALRSDTFTGFLKENGFEDLGEFLNVDSQKGSASSVDPKESLKDDGLSFKDFMMENVVQNPYTYEKLLSMTLEEINFHKLENLENDYQEFANAAAQAQKTLLTLMSNQNSTTTAEFVCKLQANMGRMLSLFPNAVTAMSPDSFLMITTSIDGIIRTGASNVSTFVDGKLYMDGYTPYTFYYNQIDPSLAE